MLDDEQRRPRVAHGLDVPQEQPAARLGVGFPPVVAERQPRLVAALRRDLLDPEEALLRPYQQALLLALLLQVAAEVRGGRHLAVGCGLPAARMRVLLGVGSVDSIARQPAHL